MNDYEIWYTIAKLPYRLKNKLLNHFKSVDKLWYYSVSCKKNDFIDEKLRKILLEAWDKDLISYIKNKLEREKINTVTITDELYPKRLKEYEDSPYMLFYKGNIQKLNEEYNVSIVGSRNCSSYGINVTNIICDHMSINHINVISGMARGIDSIAHERCVKKEAYNCAVLGSGIDVIYPKENNILYGNIIKTGCVVSQFIPGTKPFSHNFPIRNRVISALGDILIVVEAGEKSGSLITAGAAIEQGKEVLAVPGNILSSQSKGTNKLIKEGANVLTEIDEIFNVLKIQNREVNNCLSEKMNLLEKKVYNNISNSPIHFDDIFRLTNIDIKQLYEVLFELQLKDEIMCLSGNYFVRNSKFI